MLRVGVIGATGYTGEQLIKILVRHPQIKITYTSAKVDKKQKIADIFPYFSNILNLECDNLDLDKTIELCDLLFLALPHTVSMQFVPKLLESKKIVIDFSADYRLNDVNVYKDWYKTTHKDKKNIEQAVYGLPELYREDIKKASLIANPGCYPTAAILALIPITISGFADLDSITIDAKSGLTGAGRKAAIDFSFSEINENIYAYKVNNHQHAPEINQELSKITGKNINAVFVPHVIPINRGIIETIYIKLKKNNSVDKIHDIYRRFYKTEKFVRIKKIGDFPKVKDVFDTNYCDIGLGFVKDKKLLVIVSAIDNLMKGASSQAVQNMNIMCGFKEAEGLR